MKYVDEYRDPSLAQSIAKRIAMHANPDYQYRFMEFCGGHTHAIARYGVKKLLPPNVRMIHGPGCPVCVLPIGRIDMAISLAMDHGAILCSYGDVLRVPASGGNSLIKARAKGCDIRMVYSPQDALQIAKTNPGRQVVFFAIGFETTTPPTALVLHQASQMNIENFSVICNHVLTTPAISAILDGAKEGDAAQIDGVVGPAHVSVITGSEVYLQFSHAQNMPIVIAGFEPLDVLQAIKMLMMQVNEGRSEVENEFIRAVTPGGNQVAKNLTSKIFDLRNSFEWRGLGFIPHSALRIRDEYRDWDAEYRFSMPYQSIQDNKACECSAILRGLKEPVDCKIFGTVCTPENPIGSCMVSSEGACAAHYSYGRSRNIENQIQK